METTTDHNATSSNTKATKTTSVDLKGMEPKFHKAAMQGNIDVFQDMGEGIKSILTPNKNTILHIHFTNYTESVSETFVEEVLAMCPSLLLKANVKGETILHIAARYGHHEIVKKLIACAKARPKDINEVEAEKTLIRAINVKKDTAMHEAARHGYKEVVDVLINEEPDHSHFGKNADDETPLYIAVERQYWNVVDTILDNGNLPQYNGSHGRTALHAATLNNKREIVSKLLARSLSAAKEADENGWLPLHLAALLDYTNVVEELVSKDRSTAYMRDKKGRTALHFAALYRSVHAMQKIIEYCPDCCEVMDEKGCNALHYTTMNETSYSNLADYEEEKEILKNARLMRNLCNEKDDDGNTPLHYIVRLAPKWKTSYNHVLLEPQFLGEVDTMACNKYGQTALDIAGPDMSPIFLAKNKLVRKLRQVGAKLGGRVLDKHIREKEKEKRHDSAVDEKKKKPTDYLSEVGKPLSVVATLIATVTFTAGFTLPGGLIQEGQHVGSPILKDNPAFKAFVITDSLSFVLSLSAVVILFCSSIIGCDGPEELEILYVQCTILITVALVFMVIAFGTGIYAVLDVSKVFGVVTLLIVLSFFIIITFVFFVFGKEVKDRFDAIHYSRRDCLRCRVTDFQLSNAL